MSKLQVLNGWAKISTYFARRSAQSFFTENQMAFAATGCGSSCGSDDQKPKPSSCGASEDEPKPSSCGASGDEPKPSACGSSCGADDK